MENEKPKRLFPSTQLLVALDSRVLKTYLWICSWMIQGGVRYYSRQFAKATKLDLSQLRAELTGEDNDTDSYDLKN